MLSRSIVEEVDSLLKRGTLSQRSIAAHLGVSRGIVSAIARGRRGLHGREAIDNEPAVPLHRLPPTRCPHCGYRVYMPCLICVAREHHERHRILRLFGWEMPHSPRPDKLRARQTVPAPRPPKNTPQHHNQSHSFSTTDHCAVNGTAYASTVQGGCRKGSE
jgi:hypothetical protein